MKNTISSFILSSCFSKNIGYWGLFLLIVGADLPTFAQTKIYCTANNKALCEAHLKSLAEHQLGKKPIGEIAIEVGEGFLGTPYEGKTLEQGETEQLVVCLSGLDCTTFLENVVAMSRLARMDQCDFEDFTAELTHIRYRAGELAGYSSRLHYFTEWIADNVEKGVVKDVTQEIGGEIYDKQIDFMSTHRSAYAQLANDSFYQEIIGIEAKLNQHTRHFILKSRVAELEKGIKNGDLIAITTSVNGLDISHTGIAIHQNGRVHLLHASTGSKQVEISKKPLADYLAGNKSQSGIMVLRLL